MKKEWFRRNWLLIIIVVGEVILAYLIWLSGDWFFGGSRQTFGPLNSYIFIWLSIVIASIAALSSVRASEMASKSLELTRATTRPFMTYSKFGITFPSDLAILHIWICNTGVHPADNVSVDIALFTIASKDGKEQPLTSPFRTSALFFPKQELIFSFGVEDPKHVDLIKAEKTLVRISIDYQYTLTGTKHQTVQAFKLLKGKSGITSFALQLVSDKSYWN